MQLFNKKTWVACSLMVLLLTACNKEFEDIVGPQPPLAGTPPPATGQTVNEIVNTDTSFSFFRTLVGRAGLSAILQNSIQITAFIPDNNAFRASGIPIAPPVSIIDTPTARAIVSYAITPQVVRAANIPTTFPNIQYPTFFNPAPALSPFLRLTTFPSRRATFAYVNNIPLTATDIAASNGVIHKTAALVAPPSRSIFEIVTADTTLTFLVAALARADSGRTTIANGSLTEALKSIGANLTLFAPTNQAFRNLFGAMNLPLSPAVFNALPVTQVRGIIAYHILGVRAFSVNMPETATAVPTFLNTSVPTHPGVTIRATFTGPFANFTVTGAANRGMASNVVTRDIHATNGVVHRIDMVLLPQ